MVAPQHMLLKSRPQQHACHKVSRMHRVLQDIGFDGISPEEVTDDNVINRYFDIYFPRAIHTAQTLRARDGNGPGYIWTTHVRHSLLTMILVVL